MRREDKGGWCIEQRRGRWYVVDRRTRRRVKAHGRGHAETLAREKNRTELFTYARFTVEAGENF